MLRVLFWVVVILMLVGVTIVNNKVNSDRHRLRSTKINLMFSRESIRLFSEKNDRFPESLHEMNEYAKKGKKYLAMIKWRFSPMESISSYHPSNSSEHSVLDDTGGLYYNSKTGVLKVNITKPLKSYWRLYFGKRKDEVPAEW